MDRGRAGIGEFGEEIVAFVIDNNEGGEVFDLDLPDRFHAQFFVFDHFHLFDAVLSQSRRRTADGAQIKAAVFLAGLRHGAGTVALGQHDHRAAGFLELVNI